MSIELDFRGLKFAPESTLRHCWPWIYLSIYTIKLQPAVVMVSHGRYVVPSAMLTHEATIYHDFFYFSYGSSHPVLLRFRTHQINKSWWSNRRPLPCRQAINPNSPEYFWSHQVRSTVQARAPERRSTRPTSGTTPPVAHPWGNEACDPDGSTTSAGRRLLQRQHAP
jgi:hypothetical protein